MALLARRLLRTRGTACQGLARHARTRSEAGRDGAPFNLGEATVTRAVVEIDDGLRGYGHVLGRDAEQARRVAILDALWQGRASRDVVEAEVLSPIAERIAAERGGADAATRVDFFTLVRGEDET